VMSKYYIDPRDPASLITVELHVQWDDDGNFKVIPSRCHWTQGTSPCTSNMSKPCDGRYAKCDSHSKDMCTDSIGKMEFIAKDNHKFGDASVVFPPENITVEWAKFARETYAMRSYINSMSRRMDKTTQTMVWDQFRYDQNIIQVLLKDWSLSRLDPSLAISPRNRPNFSFTMITKEDMIMLNRVSNDIMQGFIDGYRAITTI